MLAWSSQQSGPTHNFASDRSLAQLAVGKECVLLLSEAGSVCFPLVELVLLTAFFVYLPCGLLLPMLSAGCSACVSFVLSMASAYAYVYTPSSWQEIRRCRVIQFIGYCAQSQIGAACDFAVISELVDSSCGLPSESLAKLAVLLIAGLCNEPGCSIYCRSR